MILHAVVKGPDQIAETHSLRSMRMAMCANARIRRLHLRSRKLSSWTDLYTSVAKEDIQLGTPAIAGSVNSKVVAAEDIVFYEYGAHTTFGEDEGWSRSCFSKPKHAYRITPGTAHHVSSITHPQINQVARTLHKLPPWKSP